MTEKTTIEKILGLDARYPWTILVVVILIAISFSPGVGISFSDRLTSFYNTIEEIPPGSVIVIENDLESGTKITMVTALPVWIQLWQVPDIKIIIVHLHTDGPMMSKMLLDTMPESVKALKEYGEDWVLFGYAPGEETAMAGIASNIRSIYKSDFYGTPIDDLPVMKDIFNAEDYHAVLAMYDRVDFFDAGARQWGMWDVPIWVITVTGARPYFTPYYPTRVQEFVLDIDAPGYEKLTGNPGDALKLHDVRALSSAYVVIVVVIMNVLEQLNKTKRMGVKTNGI